MAGPSALRKFVAPEIIFGVGSRNFVGRYAKQFMATKVMLVTDAGVAATPWLDDVKKSLDDVGIAYVVFADVTPNPRSTEVMAGAALYEREGCDVIVSIGGGSPMDCAKGIGIVSTNRADILNFEGVDKIYQPVPPMIFVPTTAGTSADVSQFCILSNRQEFKKVAIVSKAIVPDVALIDPETTTTKSDFLTACTALDALTHAVEAYVSTGSGVLTDASALEAIQLVCFNLEQALKTPNDLELREKLMLGSMKAGLAFSNASLGAVHAMAHSLGGFLDLAHGECNAMLLEHVIDFNYDASIDKFKIIAEAFGVDVRGLNSREIKSRLMAQVLDLKKRAGVANTLGFKGVKGADLSDLSRKAISDACMLTNPRRASKADLEVIYREAL